MALLAVHPPLLVIIGATASGKSSLAIEVARRVGGQIVCVDSMTVYRHLNIGTAKPSPAEMQAIPHHLVDLVEPDAEFTVSRFVELADAAIAHAASRGIPLVFTGGTPLYYKALFDGLFDGPGADEGIRARLREVEPATLHAKLAQLDPTAALRIHVNDTKRLIRAMEVYELTGRPISSFQTDWDQPHRRHDACWVGLAWDREALNRRINARVRAMLEAGWLDEVREVLSRFPSLSKTASEATGYTELIACVRGTMSLPDATERIKIATRQLARRQMKWFRRFPAVTWLDGSQPLETLADDVLQRWLRA